MSELSFATVRLGKTSVNDIIQIDNLNHGIIDPTISINVTCTQVPQDFEIGTMVFLWLGSNNSKGMATAWKQGFKAVGRVLAVDRGEKYNDESTSTIEISYVLKNAINRLDLLREAPSAYYWCSAMPIIGLDDHSNQTIRVIAEGERSNIKAFFYALNAVHPDLQVNLSQVYPELLSFFEYVLEDPRTGTVHEEAGNEVESIPQERAPGGENVLLYGVPGAGKSWTIQTEYCDDEQFIERVVFHPDYTYSDFVGQILPKTKDGSVRYEFQPGPFTKLLKKAKDDPSNIYFLVIEEINRGNAPAIFGDIFQLLDRTTCPSEHGPIGTSQYGITNADVAREVYDDPEAFVRIPSNMFILATMNTADQNVFTLDTAFQRRWHMRMVENSFVGHHYANKTILDTTITWHNFCVAMNSEILQKSAGMTSSEDKRLGAYFVSEDDLLYYPETDENELARKRAHRHNRQFAEKVIKYLWDDAFKYFRSDIFEVSNYSSLEEIVRQFMEKNGDERLMVFKEEIRNLMKRPVQ